jgi:hypothetical protein
VAEPTKPAFTVIGTNFAEVDKGGPLIEVYVKAPLSSGLSVRTVILYAYFSANLPKAGKLLNFAHKEREQRCVYAVISDGLSRFP